MKKPNLSVMSSIASDGIVAAMQEIRKLETDFVDIYAFMQSNDISRYFTNDNNLLEGRHLNALNAMANAFSRNEAEKIAQLINEDVKNKLISGIATFLPELTTHEGNVYTCHAAQNALCFLIDVARYLNNFGHPIEVIEIVGGSVLDGIWRGRVHNNDTYIVNRLSSNKSIHKLLKNIKKVADYSANGSKKIYLAMEYEPGNLFTIGSQDSLVYFCDQLNNSEYDSIKAIVGLNLDISHYAFISNISTEWIRSKDVIINRILHAHISDHTHGHFSDSALTTFHDENDFKSWLEFLGEIHQLKIKGSLPFSGFVALELECCCDFEKVKNSTILLNKWLNKYTING